jgi:putative transcriptional regulator
MIEKAKRGRPPRDGFGTRLVRAAEEALAIAKGEADPSTYHVYVPSDVDVRAIRRKLGMTQAQFAERFAFSASRLKDWEQGRSKPDGALRAYLLVIERETEAVVRALNAAA